MSVRMKHKSVKSEAENKSWFGKVKGIIFKTEYTSQKRMYQKASEDQIKKMFRLRKNNPKLCLHDIAKAVGVSEPVCRYWLALKEEDVLASFKSKRGRKIAKKQKQIRVKQPKSKKQKKQSTQEPETDSEEEFTLSNKQAEKNLDNLYETKKNPTFYQSDPRFWAGTKPPQSVAQLEAFKKEERNMQIGKATMHKAIVKKEKTDAQSKTEEKTKVKTKIMHDQGLTLAGTELKIHIKDKCPSCNPNSDLTLKEYRTIVFHVFNEMKEIAIENGKRDKQLDAREKQLDEMERESLGNVAERVKEGTKLCLKCEKPITHGQATRTSSIFGEGQYYCDAHEPKKEVK